MYIDSNVKDIFFTSDTHFFHKNVIRYCDRPFDSIQHMNDELIARWNAAVKPNDIVFHLGDFAFTNNTVEIVKQLNGTIFLVPGNHDYDGHGIHAAYNVLIAENEKQTKLSICPSIFNVDIKVEDEKLRFVLCHYAMRTWNKSRYGAIHLYGHSHGTLQDDPKSLSMDVGVDTNDYKPYHLDDILEKIYKKGIRNEQITND